MTHYDRPTTWVRNHENYMTSFIYSPLWIMRRKQTINWTRVTFTTENTWHDSLISREVMNGHKLVVLQTYRHQHRVLIEFRLPVWLSNEGICFQIWNHFMFSKYCNIRSQLGKYVSAICTNDEAFNFSFKLLSLAWSSMPAWSDDLFLFSDTEIFKDNFVAKTA